MRSIFIKSGICKWITSATRYWTLYPILSPWNADFRKTHNLSDKKLIALLPGSRKQEISRLLPDMIAVAQKWADYQFVIAGAPTFNKAYYDQYLNGADIKLIFNATYDLLSNAYAGIIASGTASLETALFNVPQVVVYKSSVISMAIARTVVKVKYASLVNLIMNEEIVKELIQPYCTPQTINAELENILNNKAYFDKILANYQELFSRMGKPGASARTAALIIKYAT